MTHWTRISRLLALGILLASALLFPRTSPAALISVTGVANGSCDSFACNFQEQFMTGSLATGVAGDTFEITIRFSKLFEGYQNLNLGSLIILASTSGLVQKTAAGPDFSFVASMTFTDSLGAPIGPVKPVFSTVCTAGCGWAGQPGASGVADLANLVAAGIRFTIETSASSPVPLQAQIGSLSFQSIDPAFLSPVPEAGSFAMVESLILLLAVRHRSVSGARLTAPR